MIRLFLRRLFSDRSVWLLPVSGFALTSGIGMMVLGGALYFYQLPDPELRSFYSVYATGALILLTIPMLALMSSAARLLARRRDERLSSLRLLGAGRGQLRRLVITESGVLAATGILGGTVLYLALMPAVGQLSFAGSPMGTGGLWMGWKLLAAAVCGLLLFAVAASFLGLRRVEVTPLGVRTRQTTQRVWWGRALIAIVGVVVVAVLYTQVPMPNEVVETVVKFSLLLVPLLAVQLIGPWVLKVITRVHLRTARGAERLIAARSVLESPQQMWRQVGGVALAAFVGVIAGCGMALVNVGDVQMSPEDQMIFGDLERGVWLTLFVAFLLTACSVGLNQTAQILDRRDLYRGLNRLGFTLRQLNRIRSLCVMRSLTAVLAVAVAAACVVAFPVVGWAVVSDPLTVVTVVAVLAAGVGLIAAGTAVTRPTMRQVTAEA